jgi:transcriptional regulator with XRE-family HTH domain
VAGVGDTLRQARHEQKLTLEQVEAAIRVRSRYLAALEAERFDVLPGVAYARAFTREYARFLGLDPEPLLDRLDDDLTLHEPPPTMLVQPRSNGLLGRYWLGAALVLIIVGIAVWGLSRHGRQPATPAAITKPPATAAVVTPRPPKPTTTAHPLPAPRLTVAASRGDCWLSVHLGSATGPTLWEGTLPAGKSLHFERRRLWIRAGAPSSLDLRLNGRLLTLPRSSGAPLNLVVTRSGARAA